MSSLLVLFMRRISWLTKPSQSAPPFFPPNITAFRCAGVSLFHGFFLSIPNSDNTQSISLATQPSPRAAAAAQGVMAPSLIDRAGFGTTRSGSISGREPRPLQSPQKPSGELNENDCGDSSGKESSQCGQATRSLNARSSLGVSTLITPLPSRSP